MKTLSITVFSCIAWLFVPEHIGVSPKLPPLNIAVLFIFLFFAGASLLLLKKRRGGIV